MHRDEQTTNLHKIVDKFYTTVKKFIKWICKKFELQSENEVIRNFEKETNILIYPEKQLKKEWNFEL